MVILSYFQLFLLIYSSVGIISWIFTQATSYLSTDETLQGYWDRISQIVTLIMFILWPITLVVVVILCLYQNKKINERL